MSDNVNLTNVRLTNAQLDELAVGVAVRFVGGKYNGYQGHIAKLCDSVCRVTINFEGRPCEIVEELRFVEPLAKWRADKTATELNLRGGSQ